MKRLFSFSALLLCSLLGFAQFSGSGSGTEADPYLITSPDELFEVRNSPSSYYKLMNDIDLGDWLAEEYPTQGWVPIQNFTGTFDGNGHSITNLFINRPSTQKVGLFGNAERPAKIVNVSLLNPVVYGEYYTGSLLGYGIECTISDITVKNAHIEGSSTNSYEVGGCVGHVKEARRFKNVTIIGSTIIGYGQVGGIIGEFNYDVGSTLEDCYVYECKVIGTYTVGGLMGYAGSSAVTTEIIRCYVSGTIINNFDGYGSANGIVGYAYMAGSPYTGDTFTMRIADCRFDGRVEAGYVAGIGGGQDKNSNKNKLAITHCIVSGNLYAKRTVRGISENSSTSCVCCSDTIYSTEGTAVRIGPNVNGYAYNGMAVYSNNNQVEVEDGGEQGTGYSLRALKRKNTYIGLSYDFDNVWSIAEDRTFPYLKAQSTPPIITSCVGGQNGLVKGTASGNGTIYVFVGDKMYEGEIVNGEWSMPVSEMPIGAVVNVYAETDGMKPSCKTSAISEPEPSFVVLDEASTTIPENNADVDVLLKRTIKADEWSTICLPFTATGEQVKTAFGDDVQLASFTGWESEEDGNGAIVAINVMFTTVSADEGIAANTPMLIKVSETVTEATFDGVTLEPEEEPMVQVGKKASERGWFYGTYAKTIVPEENLFLSGNEFWYSTGKTAIKGFRGYFEFRDVLDAYYDDSEVKVHMLFDDDATGIETIDHSSLNIDHYYNLAGQRVGKGYKGVVIENGKKIIKK